MVMPNLLQTEAYLLTKLPALIHRPGCPFWVIYSGAEFGSEMGHF